MRLAGSAQIITCVEGLAQREIAHARVVFWIVVVWIVVAWTRVVWIVVVWVVVAWTRVVVTDGQIAGLQPIRIA